MKTRHLILIMIGGTVFMMIGSLSIGYITTMTVTLWGVRWPLVYLELCGVAMGIGVAGFGVGVVGAIMQTKDIDKKEIVKIDHEQNHKDAVDFGMKQYRSKGL